MGIGYTKLMPAISAKRVIATSFLVDISDFLLSIVIVITSGSVIMLSQALEGAADLLSSGLLLYGHGRSNRPADKTHPFGYGKELYFWTLISAMIMFGLTATLSFYYGWHRFHHPRHINNIGLAYAGLIVTAATNFYSFSLSFRRLIGKRNINQISKIILKSNLIETKTTLVLDLMGTLASVLGLISLLFYSLTNNFRFDGLGAMLIGVVLAFLAATIIIEIKDLVIGVSASEQTQEKIKQAVLSVSQVNKVLDLRTMIIGNNKILVNIEVNLEDKLTTNEIEVLVDKIKNEIQKDVPRASHIQIELESPEGN